MPDMFLSDLWAKSSFNIFIMLFKNIEEYT